ncbi:PIN domain-containing protein [Streptosporangium sp. NPDC005286]|uniref:PIN domain-containing protein n=1 Tax=Streptosporangium sp. NPDC005286 TaxID=3154463 RepID=UPI0033A3E4A5
MANLDTAFREYYPPTDEQRQVAMTKGLVCLDANVLLDAYRFNPRVRTELFDVLEKLNDRLWIPHQVAFEFHKNRINVIGDQAKAYASALKALEEFEEYFTGNVNSKLNVLGRTVALTEEEQTAIIDPVIQGIKLTVKAILKLQERHGVALDMISNDEVLSRLENLLQNKVGDPLGAEEEERARNEAMHRVKNKIPPGYADSEKADPAGDYLVWHQMLEEAKRREAPILFITRDVKEDWFRREKGQTISARAELIREAREVADCDLTIMPTQSFLVHARKYLNAQVSDELLRQVEKLPELENDAPEESVILLSRREQKNLLISCEAAVQQLTRELHMVNTRLASIYQTEREANLSNEYRDKSQMQAKWYASKRDLMEERQRRISLVIAKLRHSLTLDSDEIAFPRSLVEDFFDGAKLI